MVKFQPLTKEQASRVLPKGEYQFAVESAIAKKSKKGADMFEVNLRLYGDGKETLCRDYLLCDGPMAHKLRHFCEVVGKLEDYEAGELYAEAFQGLGGRVKVAVEESDEYPDKNIVKDYVVDRPKEAAAENGSKQAAQQAAAQKARPASDEIPF